jgi:hypothetical protein
MIGVHVFALNNGTMVGADGVRGNSRVAVVELLPSDCAEDRVKLDEHWGPLSLHHM